MYSHYFLFANISRVSIEMTIKHNEYLYKMYKPRGMITYLKYKYKTISVA